MVGVAELLESGEFESDIDEEFCSVNEVSPPEPARFLEQAIQPFESMLAHPHGGLLYGS